MICNLVLDTTSLSTDPSLENLNFDAGSHNSAFETETGTAIYNALTSRAGVAMLVGAVASAPSRPPVVGIEPLLVSEIGEAAFSDEMKRLTGRIVRYIIEHIGGNYESRGIKVTKALGSHYRSGSTYSFPASVRK